MRTRPSSLLAGLTAALLTVGGALLISAPAAYAAQPRVGLGTAASFAVLAGTTVTNTGPTTVSGDLGVSPGSAVTGFPPGQVVNGTQHVADAVALQASSDLVTAYDDAAGRSPAVDQTGRDLGGQVLVAGTYSSSSSLGLTGTVTLDAEGDPDAVFVFQAGSTLLAAGSSTVALVNGAQACNVYWQVGSSATVGPSSRFVGTVMALTSITVQTGATVQGRMLARNGQVSLDTNSFSVPTCAASVPSSSPTTTPTTTPTSTPSSTPSSTPLPTPGGPTATPSGPAAGGAGPQDSGGGSAGGSGGGSDSSSVDVPVGHPDTGASPTAPSRQGPAWLLIGLVALVGAAFSTGAGLRSRTLVLRRQ